MVSGKSSKTKRKRVQLDLPDRLRPAGDAPAPTSVTPAPTSVAPGSLPPEAPPPKSLQAILGDGAIRRAWNDTPAAPNHELLPRGRYTARVARVAVESSPSKGTPGVVVEFEITEGEHRGRRLWHRVWLTPAAIGMAKRDLGSLGIDNLDQLERPLADVITCELSVAIRQSDDGREFNHVARFNVVSRVPISADPFAPADEGRR